MGLRGGCGMGLLVDLPEAACRDVGVDLGRRDVCVTQHGLDVPKIGAALEHQCRHGMSEEVAGARLPDLGGVDVSVDQYRQPFGGEGTAVGGDEEVGTVCSPEKGGPRGREIALDPPGGSSAQWDHSVLSAFAQLDRDNAASEIQGGKFDIDHFLAAQAGGVENLEDRPVAEPEVCRGVRLAEDSFGFTGRQDRSGKAALAAWKNDAGGRVLSEPILLDGPAKEPEDIREPVIPGESAERVPACMTLAPDVERVLLECVVGYLIEGPMPFLVEPDQEEPKMRIAASDGVM